MWKSLKLKMLVLGLLFLNMSCVGKIPSSQFSKSPSFKLVHVDESPAYLNIRDSLVYIAGFNQMGSGVVLYKSEEFTYIITDEHVLDQAWFGEALVGFPNSYNGVGVIWPTSFGKVIDTDKALDLCLIRMSTKDVPEYVKSAKFISENYPSIMTEVYCAGFPCNNTMTVSKGIISRYFNYKGRFSLQVDSVTTHGGSGGLVCTKDGVVLGIVDAIWVGQNGQEIPNFNIVTSSYEIRNWLNNKYSFLLK